MNLLQILNELEKLLTEILLAIVFIPKTLIRIITRPNWVPGYIDEELTKDGRRFGNYMSPIVLFLINSILLFFLYEYVMYTSGGFGYLPEYFKGILDFSNAGDVESKLRDVNTFWLALGFMLLPILYAVFLELFRSAKFTREHIKRTIFIQSYYFSPVLLVYFTVIIFNNLLLFNELFEFSSKALILLTFIWFSVVQIKLLFTELQIGKIKATLLYLMFSIFLTIVYLGFDAFTHFSSISSESTYLMGVTIPKTGEYEISIKNRSFQESGFTISLEDGNDKKGNKRLRFGSEDQSPGPDEKIPMNFKQGDSLNLIVYATTDAIFFDLDIAFINKYRPAQNDSLLNLDSEMKLIDDPYSLYKGYQGSELPKIHPKFKFSSYDYEDSGTEERLVWRATVFNFIKLIYKVFWVLLFGFLFFAIIRGLIPRKKKPAIDSETGTGDV